MISVYRLLTKLGTVVDRTELNLDTAWAETGDRYMLKLFRDYVFHQVMEDGRPFLDMAHVIACLNRLDAGVPDKVRRTNRKFATSYLLVMSLIDFLSFSFISVVS